MDRPHRQSGVDAEEGADAAIGARPLEADESGRQHAETRAGVTVDRAAGDAELGDLRDELERELLALPVVVDDRNDLAVAEVANPVADRACTSDPLRSLLGEGAKPVIAVGSRI